MSIEVNVTGALKKLKPPPGLQKALADLLNGIQREISQRTLQGRDADGQGFEAYTPEYKNYKNGITASGSRQRKVRGRKVKKQNPAKAGRGDVVNLTYSGKMMAAMQTAVKTIGNGVTEGIINFSSAAESKKARVHNDGLGRQPKRHFFAISQEQKQKIIELITRRYKDNGR